MNESQRLLPTHRINQTNNSDYRNQNGQLYEEGNDEDDEGFNIDNQPRGDILKSTVFGGLDGLSISFLLLSCAAGGELRWTVVVLLGLSNVVANALAMGISEFLSSKAHMEFVMAEKRRALWEFKHYRQNEVDQMIQKFEGRGMSRQDAELVVNKMAQYEELFVTVMVNEELGFGVPDDDDGYLLKDAFVMAASYLGYGTIPILVYFAAGASGVDPESTFALASLVSATGLFVLGALKSSFNSSVSWIYSGLEAVIPGCACAGLAYALARVIASSLGKFF